MRLRPKPCRVAYLHGFASSPLSAKAQALAPHLRTRGTTLYAPDLNRPSFARLSYAAMLAAVDELDAGAGDPSLPWCFIGSSLGGWLAARWAALHPERVHALLLLCPGFDLADRWPALFGATAMAAWQRDGQWIVPDATGRDTAIHWAFMEEARTVDPRPVVPCPATIVHGRNDDVVPIESSRRYAAEVPGVRLVEVDDDHSLASSLDRITAELDLLLGAGSTDRRIRPRPWAR